MVLDELLFNTVLGSRPYDEKNFQNLDYILCDEHIFQDLSRFYEDDFLSPQISLEILSSLRTKPHSISSNLVLNDLEEMTYEIGLLSKNARIAIIETTTFENGKDLAKLQKISQILGIPIFTGFDIFIDKKTLFQESLKNQVFLNKEAFLKKLSLEFSLGSLDGVKFAFIGPIYIENLVDELELLKCEAYFELLKKSKEKIPIFFEFSLPIINGNSYGLEGFGLLEKLIEKSQLNDYIPQIILVNFPLNWHISQKEESKKFELTVELKNEDKIMKILGMGFQIIFDVQSSNGNEHFFVEFVKTLIKRGFHRNFSISFGNKFKHHLKKYGGVGFKQIADFRAQLGKMEGLDDIFRDNMMKILRWKTMEEVKPIAIKKWICPHCQKEFEENIEKFRKFEKEFCSIKCLRNFFSK